LLGNKYCELSTGMLRAQAIYPPAVEVSTWLDPLFQYLKMVI
jgi:hypothetical protein